MKQSVIKDLSTAELVDKLTEETGSLSRMQMSHAVSPLENPIKIRDARKSIARIRTELRKRELNENKK